MKYEFYSSTNGKKVEWRWRLKATNNKIVASGEGFSSKTHALRGIKIHQKCAATQTINEVDSKGATIKSWGAAPEKKINKKPLDIGLVRILKEARGEAIR